MEYKFRKDGVVVVLFLQIRTLLVFRRRVESTVQFPELFYLSVDYFVLVPEIVDILPLKLIYHQGFVPKMFDGVF